MRTRSAAAVLLSLVALLFGGVAQAQVAIPRPRDLLISDGTNDRILLFRPSTGATIEFSPRAGSGTNYLARPSGIAVDPGGSIYVSSENANVLVQIDPATGAQSVVHAWNLIGGDLGVLDVGTYPRGIDIATTGTFLDPPDLYLMGGGALRRVSRGALGATSSSIVSSDASFTDNYNDLALLEDGGGAITDIFVSGYAGLTRYRFDLTSAAITINSFNLRDVEAVGSRLFVVQQDPCGPSQTTQSGVWEVTPPTSNVLTPISVGGLLECPLAVDAYSETEFYVLEYASGTRSLVRLDDQGGGTWTQTYLGDLAAGDGVDIYSMDVVPADYAPEPGAGPLGACAVAIAVALRRRRTAADKRARRD